MTKTLKSTAIALVFTIISSACATNEQSVNILNAENANGFILENAPVISSVYETTPIIYETTRATEESAATTETFITTATTERTTTTETSEATTTTERTTTTEAAATTRTERTTTTETSATTTTTKKPETTFAPRYSGTLNYDEVIGIWISYLELKPILEGKTEAEFRESFRNMMKNCSDFGINTVYVHVRAFSDAFYKSDYYPWSKYVTGTLGKTPTFDPLEIMTAEAHNFNISFHAWINPLRAQTNADITSVPYEYKTGTWYSESDDCLVKSGDYWYLNPAYDEVIALVAAGAAEIVKNYDVDGLHIDDYFYPTTDEAFDKKAFEESGMKSLSDFRRENCTNLVKSLYNTVKSHNSEVLFGVSPQGSIENNMNTVYADVEKWCADNEYCDYMAPQIYYGFENSAQPFEECLERWHNLAESGGMRLIIGLAIYKIGNEDVWAGEGKYEWLNSGDILKRQFDSVKTRKNYGGVIFFSYNYMFNPDYLTAAIKQEISVLDVYSIST